MTSAPGNNHHLTLCATFENKIPSIVFHSTIDVDTTATTLPTENSLNDDHSTHSAMSTKTHPLLVHFDDTSDQLLSHPVFDDHAQEYMHWHY